jgi:MOSC domain-containing protein YiiM
MGFGPKLLSVNVGLPRDIPWKGRTVHTGIWKDPVMGRCRVGRLNLAGDGQGDLAGHGGEQRAVFVYQIESYRHWQDQLQRNDFVYGQFGENFTISGLPTTRCASVIDTRSGPRCSRSPNLASPAIAWASGWTNRGCRRC